MAGQRKTEGAGTIALLSRALLAAREQIVSDSALRQAKLLLLDTIGCGIAGAREDVARAVAEVAMRGTAPECALIGRAQKTDLLNAVLANGVAVRVLDLNDYIIGNSKGQPEAGGHPSDNIPVALAVGAARKCSGRDILSAIVIGYELYASLQRLMDRAGPWDGVTGSGLVTPAIAGLLMGLDETRLSHALALGLARAATPALVRRGDISSAKSVANALVAQSGVQAALLAEHGLTGPLAILDDAYGLRALFSNVDMDSLTAPFPAESAILRAHVKTYPCVNTAQSAVAAALKLRSALSEGASSLSRIEVTMADYPVIKRQQEDPGRIRPQSREAADHSFTFVVATALIDGQFGIAQFENGRWRDPAIISLMEKIELRRDAQWNARVPGGYPCAIRAVDRTGREYSAEIPYPPGFSTNGLDEHAVIAKFHAVTESILSRSARERIVDVSLEFDHSPSTQKLDTAIAIEESIR